MKDSTDRNLKSHNVVIVIITIASIGAIVESINLSWEFWVLPLILCGIIAVWGIHIRQYRDVEFRENFYMIFSMIIAFFHGAHFTSYFDLFVTSSLLLVTSTLLKRKLYLHLNLAEFYLIMIMQTVHAVITKAISFDSLTISRVVLHCVAEFALYRALLSIIDDYHTVEKSLELKERDEVMNNSTMEDFLVNISHELRTPVNVITGMSELILKKNYSEDVESIRNAGIRLSHQIEEIQDYSEIQRGDALIVEEKYSIISMVNDIFTGLNITGVKKGIELILDLDPNLPALLKGDGSRLGKIVEQLLDNAIKFTKSGGVYLKITGIRKEYGINLIIEVTDTGVGMKKSDIEKISKGDYQANRKRNRSTGGIGLGLSIVYGFVRLMNGFVTIESEKNKGTTVRISVVQEVLDATPCLRTKTKDFVNIAYHVNPEKFKNMKVRAFYNEMATNMAKGLRVNLYPAPSLTEIKKVMERRDITHVFMGYDEYRRSPEYFEELAKDGIKVAVFLDRGISRPENSSLIYMSKPIYSYPIAEFINGDANGKLPDGEGIRPVLDGVRALIVDDEPLNLVVASGLFNDYNMITETAESGQEAINKYENKEYDVIFLDHMMPEMDGIEAMKKLKRMAERKGKKLYTVVLTANAISGAKEMFLREGFDGFISKPIKIADFERVMNRGLSEGKIVRNGGAK
ncbi:hybrid sensor histidine kinase/response regulator [Butyrivibrio sp. JL13D10]|uniref:hybrid sensor histidine kinase/response regulator n=1 Tax=Butyrivibrio sp. JL13D10 TaxID=3236815 RepID=UPI0038B55E4B